MKNRMYKTVVNRGELHEKLQLLFILLCVNVSLCPFAISAFSFWLFTYVATRGEIRYNFQVEQLVYALFRHNYERMIK